MAAYAARTKIMEVGDMKQGEWLRRYKDQLIKRGLDDDLADDATGAVELADVNLELDDPEDCADEELSYWGEG